MRRGASNQKAVCYQGMNERLQGEKGLLEPGGSAVWRGQPGRKCDLSWKDSQHVRSKPEK